MTEYCPQGNEYGCPHRKKCDSNEPMNISSTDSQNPHLIYLRAKDWSNTTLTWADRENLYACHPKNLIRKRNIEIMHGETFYEKDTKQIREKVMEEVQETINELKKSRS